MRVLLDPQVFLLGHCGLLKYYSYLYQALKEEGIEIYTPVIYSITPSFSKKYYPFPALLPAVTEKLTGLAIKKLTRRRFYWEVAKKNYDVLFITSDQNETGFLKYNGKKPFVMTIHDTMIGVNGKNMYLDPQNQYSLQMGYLAHHARQIISISNHTTEDLINRFLIEPEKINTIYHTHFLPDEADSVEHLPERYVLFVGNRNGRKNFLGWVDAVAPFLNMNGKLKVLVTGKLTEYEQFFLEKMGVYQHFKAFENITDSQLNFLYRHAICLVYPSLYEGFGLPVLEAMANGCPVITTRRSSIPEVAGDAAIYADPDSTEDFVQAILRIARDQATSERLIKAGFMQAASFSWQETARQTIRAYEQAAEEGLAHDRS